MLKIIINGYERLNSYIDGKHCLMSFKDRVIRGVRERSAKGKTLSKVIEKWFSSSCTWIYVVQEFYVVYFSRWSSKPKHGKMFKIVKLRKFLCFKTPTSRTNSLLKSYLNLFRGEV